MLKNLQVVCTLIITGLLVTGLSSCGEDEPDAPPRVSLSSVEPLSVSENVGIIKIEVTLDRPYSKDISIEYTLSGTAVDLNNAGSAALADYQISGGSREVDIDKGETSGTIEIEILNDGGFEEDETIIIHLDEVEDEPELEITNDDEVTITITNDDQQLIASVESSTLTVNESDGVDVNGELIRLQVGVTLDQPAPSNITVKYELAGTAIDTLSGAGEGIPAAYWDYYINGVSGEVPITAGQTSGVIEIQVYTDFIFEDSDTIEITLVASSGVEVSASNKATVIIEQQDGKGIQLGWPAHENDVDMDMFLYVVDESNVPEAILAISANDAKTPPFELIFVPDLFGSGKFGLSYVYYSGNADPMNFEVTFVDVVDGEPEPEASREVYTATYGAVNKNPWDNQTSGTFPPAVVQTFTIEDGNFTNISQISVPTSGSRSGTFKFHPSKRVGDFYRVPGLKRK